MARVSGEMSALNGDVKNALEMLEGARSEMVMRLAACMAVARDAGLQQRFGKIAGVDPGHEFMIGQIDGQSWLKVGGRGYTIERKPQVGLPAIDFDEVVRSPSELERMLRDAMQRTHATREKMIMGRAASQHRGPFQVDEDVALAELEQAWAAGGYHGFSADGGTWSAISGAGEVLTGVTPDELDRAIRGHWQAMQ